MLLFETCQLVVRVLLLLLLFNDLNLKWRRKTRCVRVFLFTSLSKKLFFLLPKNEHQKVKSRFCVLNILNNSIMAVCLKILTGCLA